MYDRSWKEIERELRREEPVNEAAVERIVGEIRRRRPSARRFRLWEWLTRPRLVPAAPLWALGGAVAAVLAALVLAGGPRGGAGPANPGAQPVQFVLLAPEAARVSLAGDFNNWDRDATPLRRAQGNGVWSVVVPLRSGRYRYVFVVDGTRWVPDAAAPRGPENEFGPSSVVLVGGST